MWGGYNDGDQQGHVSARMETSLPMGTTSISVSQQQSPKKFAPVVAPKPKFNPYKQLEGTHEGSGKIYSLDFLIICTLFAYDRGQNACTGFAKCVFPLEDQNWETMIDLESECRETMQQIELHRLKCGFYPKTQDAKLA